jgi:hypothetical protein
MTDSFKPIGDAAKAVVDKARPFTDKEKLDAIQREIGMRRRVYQRRVYSGQMEPETADWEIAVMEAIARDYRDKIQPTMI